MSLKEKHVYRLKEDYCGWDYDGDDNWGPFYLKDELVFICTCTEDLEGCYATIASKRVTINWGPAGTKELLPLLEEVDFDLDDDDKFAQLLLILNGNKSIFDNELRWN